MRPPRLCLRVGGEWSVDVDSQCCLLRITYIFWTYWSPVLHFGSSGLHS